jgi:hypothetical protein
MQAALQGQDASCANRDASKCISKCTTSNKTTALIIMCYMRRVKYTQYMRREQGAEDV